MFSHRRVSIALDPNFAQACNGHALDLQQGHLFAQQVWEYMGNTKPMTPSNFLDFHEKSLLLKGVYYKPGEGVWMTLNTNTFPSDVFPVIYHGHNADFFIVDQLWLLRAFGAWVDGACALLNWN
jgi:hypothetical protein